MADSHPVYRGENGRAVPVLKSKLITKILHLRAPQSGALSQYIAAKEHASATAKHHAV